MKLRAISSSSSARTAPRSLACSTLSLDFAAKAQGIGLHSIKTVLKDMQKPCAILLKPHVT